MEQRSDFREIGLLDIAHLAWRRKSSILQTLVGCMAIGLVCFWLWPRSYSASVELQSISGAQMADYAVLADEKVFPYSVETLYTEYLRNLQEPDRLAAIALSVDRGSASKAPADETTDQLPRPDESFQFRRLALTSGQGPAGVVMQVNGSDPRKVTRVALRVLEQSQRDFAGLLAFEVRSRAMTVTERNNREIAELQVAVDSLRQRGEEARSDRIAHLTEQVELARSLGIEKSMEAVALDLARQNSGSVQINTSIEQKLRPDDQRSYLQGYAALEEQIRILKGRKNNDPYLENLREMQQKIYSLANSQQAKQILVALEKSPLGNVNTAEFVRFSRTAISTATSPRLSLFLLASAFIGLFLGFCLVFMPESRRGAL